MFAAIVSLTKTKTDPRIESDAARIAELEAKCERLRMQGKSQDDYAATCAGPPVDMVRDTL